jgi:type I site-specific restriction endonuclease
MACPSEYRTRKDKIDKMLEKSGWIVKDRTKVYEEVDTKQSDFNSDRNRDAEESRRERVRLPVFEPEQV